MKNTFNSQKGSIAPLIVIVAIIVIIGIWFAAKKGEQAPVTTATSSPITLISPNGGETLIIGATTTVSFKIADDVTNAHSVVIWLEPGAAPLATIPATTTTYSFVLPESVMIGGDAMAPLEVGKYTFKVAVYDGVPCTGFCMATTTKEIASDSSDAEFMIATSTAAVSTSTPATSTTTPRAN